MKYVIYDFNGTILDDTEVCLKAENYTIEHFGLKRPPLTMEEYLRIFTFPVKKYYENVGFDWSKNSYAEVGQYWFDWYRRLRDEYEVHEGVIEVLQKNHEKGNKNILLSASSLVELKKQLEELNIASYFDEVLGIDNIYAGSKIDIALDWIKDKDPADCLMIGDTLHDLETAKAMGVNCVLVAKGHQAKEILEEECDKVYEDIREVELI
ncbi:MAG: HAD hydrolase-like protein [Erysipelotrichaceae bacterium]|nr:HAD hydrolase-like protein [Erysipelotrichaceae bacterium]